MMTNKRVIYKETNSCNDCFHNTYQHCQELGKPLRKINFDDDCPLPKLSDVETFTRYITKDKKLECCGNCKHWKHWNYNKHLKADLGVCQYEESNVLSVTCNSKPCTHYEEVE